MILTGNDLSNASVTATETGDDGFWTKSYGGETDRRKIHTWPFFKE